MTEDLIEAARRLTGVLANENAALGAFDIRAATQLLDEKRGAAEAFVAASGDAVAGCGDALGELLDAARANRLLLERAIAVQARVIGIVARAVPRAVASGYGADGGLRGAHRTPPITLSARA
jgi:hypothetical protein